MKKIPAYILLLSVMFNVFSLGQLFKLPVLFEHFQEHRIVETDISFLDYLIHHYSFEEHTDNDENRDMQLPFKSHTYHATGFDFHGAVKFTHLPKAPEVSDMPFFSSHYLLYIPTPYQQSQFKPPRS